MKFIALAFVVAAACGSCSPALAACHWEWLCNGEGACKQMPACDSVHETPPMIDRGQVESSRRAMSNLSSEIAKPSPRAMSNLSPVITPPEPPPLAMRPVRIVDPGRSGLTCEHIMRLGRSGRWSWSEACYCTDKSRNPDASRPFANIVRCDDPSGTPPVFPGGDFVVDGRAGRSFPLLREHIRGLP